MSSSRYKGSREIHDSDKYEITTEGDKQILVIRNVYGEDADEYSVRASNKGGSRVSRSELEISCEWNVFVLLVAFLKQNFLFVCVYVCTCMCVCVCVLSLIHI